MNILIVANNDVGLYRFRKELIVELVKNNKVYISLPQGEYIERLIEIGCEYVATDFNRRGMNLIREIALIRKYEKLLCDMKPDVVLTYTIKPNIYCGMICAKKNIPYISNITGLGTAIENRGFLQRVLILLYRHGLRKAGAVFFQNERNKAFFLQKGIIKSNWKLIPGSGVNLSQHCFEEYPPSNGFINLLFVGRIMKDKGIEELLECAEYIMQKYDGIQFSLLGLFDDEQYEERIQKLQDKEIIKYYGHQEDVHAFFKSHHAVVHPSYHEGMSNVLLENAACGRPSLASNISGCIEIFDDGVSGIAFEPKDTQSLINAVEKFILMSHEKKMQMGKYAREKVEKCFDRSIVVNAYLEEINRILKVEKREDI